MRRPGVSCLLLCFAFLSSGPALAQDTRNWAAPPFWKPAHKAVEPAVAVEATESTVAQSAPLPFVAITPCRLMDTRNAGLPGAFGPPSLAADTTRDIPVPTHPICAGIPSDAGAYSLNFTVTNTGSSPFGFLKAWPQGAAEPNTSLLNWTWGGVTVANAAIVPAGAGGGITVRSGNASADVIIDINGYYAGSLVTGLIAGVGTNVSSPTGNVTVGLANQGVDTAQLADGGVTGSKLAVNAVTAGAIAPGQAVKSLNGLFDNVTLTAGSNVSVTQPTSHSLMISVPFLVSSLNSLSGNVVLLGGNNVSITPAPNGLTISAGSGGTGSLALPYTGIGTSAANGSVFTLFNSTAGGTGIQANGGHGGSGGVFTGGVADPGNRGGAGIEASAGATVGFPYSTPSSAGSPGGRFTGADTDNEAWGGPGVIGYGGMSRRTANSGIGGEFFGGGAGGLPATFTIPSGTGVAGISGESSGGPGGYFVGNVRSVDVNAGTPGVIGLGAAHFGETAAMGGSGGEFFGGLGADGSGPGAPPHPKVGGDGVRGSGGGCFWALGPCALPGDGFGNGGVFQGTYGVVATGRLAPLRLVPATTGIGAPTAGQHLQGELYVDSAGALFYCRIGGTPGTWVTLAP